MKKTIACIGQGFVGGSLSTGMSHAFDVWAFDKAGKVAPKAHNGARDKDGRDNLETLVERMETSISDDLSEKSFNGACFGDSFTGVYFVCLPTPMYEDGEADLRIVEGTLKELANIPGERIAVVKSTVPPGSTERWNRMFDGSGLTVVFNPEFLREASALKDFKNQNRIILGGPKKSINVVCDVYKIAYPNVPIHKTISTNAELIKYITNCFLAMKVSFANEIYQLCEVLEKNECEVDYDRIIELATLDERLGLSHWKVPGTMVADDGSGKLLKGFAGSCFIKDLNALIYVAKQLNVDPKVLNAVWEKNLEVRPEKDWENLKGRAVSITDAKIEK